MCNIRTFVRVITCRCKPRVYPFITYTYTELLFSNEAKKQTRKGAWAMRVAEELVIIEMEANLKEEVMDLLGTRLFEQGFVKEGFIESILKREENYPTGLPTEPFGVAIPHTDGDMVNQSTIAFANLKNPVKFMMMGTDDKLVDVKLIFMLALKSPDDQLDMLQKLVGLLQDPEMVSKLAEVKDVDELNELVEDKV